MAIRFTILSVGAILAVLASGSIVAGDIPAPPAKPTASAAEPYLPGLGEFMTAYVQPHHIKLWLAGNGGNWRLAAYEAEELGETFEDISTYQGTWKNVPVAQLVRAIIKPALKNVDAAIFGKDAAAFKTAYTTLTAACNSCHAAARRDFIAIKVPTADPFSDQTFGRR